ncbi:MAG: NADH-ubiquinone oxidoreductase-F iron-sulfur binding region domain-containing protein [Actinomycetes bacterium]
MRIFDTAVPIGANRVAMDVGESLAEHRARRPVMLEPSQVLDRVRDTDLRGYGGAFFPAARKWQSAINAGGGGIVVANGAESEPASAKDAALLQLRPHLVLDGLNATARATGSVEGVLWLHRGAAHSRVAIERAIVERRAAGVPDIPLRIVEGPASYLSGESSAIVRALSGGPALPITRTVPAAVRGVDGRPTLVHNIETIAQVSLAASGSDPAASRLVTVTTSAGQTVVETTPEQTLASLVIKLGEDPQAALLGGYGGTWHRWDDVSGQRLGELEQVMSAGIIMALPRSTCGLAVTAQILQYLAAASARQCGPCLFGLDELADVMTRVADGRARRGDAPRLAKISASVSGRGACHHPDGALRMLGSALQVFAADLPAHRRRSTCARRHDISLQGRGAA